MSSTALPQYPTRIPLPPYPNGWYKVAFSDELAPGDVRRISQLGEELVLWRGEDGVARVLEAYCPHLGAHLGVGGKVSGNDIRCPFHAWEFDGKGTCMRIPYSNKVPSRARLQTRPIVERNGYVAVWYHQENAAPSYEIPDVPETHDPAFTLYKQNRWAVDTHLQEVYENIVDVPHFRVVHGMEVQRAVVDLDGPFYSLELDIRRSDADAVAQVDERKESRIRSWVYGPGLSLTRVTGKLHGVSVQTLTPLAPEKIEICHRYYIHQDAPTAEMGAFFDFYAEDWLRDYRLWNRKIYRARPVLAEGDGDLAKFRRWYAQFYSDPVAVEVEQPQSEVSP